MKSRYVIKWSNQDFFCYFFYLNNFSGEHANSENLFLDIRWDCQLIGQIEFLKRTNWSSKI